MEEKRKQLLDFISMMQNMAVSVSVMQSYVVQHLLRNKRLRKLVISGNILTTNLQGVKKAKNKRIVKHWVRPGRTSSWWDNLVSGKMVEEEWHEKQQRSRRYERRKREVFQQQLVILSQSWHIQKID